MSSTIPFTSQEKWLDAASLATGITQAIANGQSYVRTRYDGRNGVRRESFAALDKAGLTYEHDTMDGNSVQVRVRIGEPGKILTDTFVSAWVKGDEADRTRGIFEKWFTNKIRIVRLDHQGGFGQPVEVAAKVNLDSLDLNDLAFYCYNRETNTYTRIQEPSYRIDQNSYLHFTTSSGGTIVISERALEKR